MLVKFTLLVSIIILFIIVVLSWYLSNKILHPKRVCIEKSMHIESKAGRFDKYKYEKLNKEDFKVKSEYGYDIEASLIYKENLNKNNIIKNEEKIIIFAHGYEYNRIGSFKYFESFIKRNYNILVYDHRNSGNSGGNSTTMGYFEKYDLITIIDEMRKRFGQDAIIGIHGESMGAATALLALELEDKINFIISDCGYSNLKDELVYQLKKQYKLPKFPFIDIASLINKLSIGYRYENIMPIEIIKEHGLNVPILFIHGENDNFTPCKMSIDMYNVRKKYASSTTILYLGKNSDHTETYWNNKEECDEVIGDFLDKINA